jgi:hypothetical protein
VSNVNVKIIVMPTNQVYEKVSLPDDAPIKRLLVALADRLGIKPPSPGEIPMHRLTYKWPNPPDRYDFKEDDTLAGRGVKEGSELLFTAGFKAG